MPHAPMHYSIAPENPGPFAGPHSLHYLPIGLYVYRVVQNVSHLSFFNYNFKSRLQVSIEYGMHL